MPFIEVVQKWFIGLCLRKVYATDDPDKYTVNLFHGLKIQILHLLGRDLNL